MSLSIGQEVWMFSTWLPTLRGTITEMELIGDGRYLSCRVKWKDELVSWCMADDLRVVSPLQLLAEQLDD